MSIRNRHTTASILAICLVAGCQKPPESAPPAPPAPTVTVVPVVTRDIPVYIEEIGKCAAPETVAIQAQVSGKVTGVFFKEGADVKKGDKLFAIDARPFETTLEQAKADLAVNQSAVAQSESMMAQYRAALEEAEADLAQSKTRQDWNALELERSKNLFETKATSKQEVDSRQSAVNMGESQIRASHAQIAKAKAQIKQGEAAIALAKARVVAAEAAVETAKINVNYATISAPLDGRAGERLVDAGNVVIAGAGTPLVVIQRLDPIYVDFTVPEHELSRVRTAMASGTLKVECWVPNEKTPPQTGTLSFLDNAVRDGSGTVKLRATLENSSRRFWLGQFVKTRLIISTIKDAPLIPVSTTQVGQSGPFVYVVDDQSVVALRPVVLGQRFDDLIAVTEGVKAGEKIVIARPFMLFPGAKVNIATPSSEAPK